MTALPNNQTRNQTSYQLYSKRDYMTSLCERFRAADAQSRILLMSMEFQPDKPEIMAVMESLEIAAGRGARIHLGIDAHSFMDSNGQADPAWYRSSRPGPLFFHTDLPARLHPPYDIRRRWLDRLAAYPNVRVTSTNKPDHRYQLPIAGRSHIKIAIIDDYLITGGCNLDYPEYNDLMIGWQDQSASDQLHRMMSRALENGNVRQSLDGRDQIIMVDNSSRILIDAGTHNQSLIFDEALRLIDTAQDWLVLTCQYFPNGITAKHLLAARRRGVKLTILYAHMWSHGLLDGSIQFVSQTIERSRLPRAMFQDGLRRDQPKIHAKLIACDAGVMIGSHNNVRAGVRLGTAEICFTSRSVALAVRAYTHIQQSISR